MAKPKTSYVCNECGAVSPKWAGQCADCKAWNSLVETVPEQGTGAHRFASLAGTAKVQALADIRPREEPRLPTGLDEFDRVLGGGLVPGGVVLIGGDPGIGKSTLLLQAHRLRCARSGWRSTRPACSCWPKSIWKRSAPR